MLGAALLLVALALATMATMHEQHYRRRRFTMLEGRVATLEKIVAGDHE